MSWVDDYLETARAVATASRRLVPKLKARREDTVVAVHAYTWPVFESFVRTRYLDARPRWASLSMNPARNGAVQTGLAFTDAPTARELVPGFDGLANRPPHLRTERVEMSGRKLRAWAELEWGGLDGLYTQFIFPIACPVAVLRGPNLLNVPLPSLDPPARRAAEAFYQETAPRLVRAVRPRGLFLLGDFAGRQWESVRKEYPDLSRIPTVVTHHPAARIKNARKFQDWTAAYHRLEGVAR